MAKFIFKLLALKKFRENRLMMARKDLVIIENNIHDMNVALRKATEDRRQLLGTSAYADIVAAETRRIWILKERIRLLEQDRERHAHWVTHLGRELKAIEKLEGKKREQFDAEISLGEKRKMDNWVAERWTWAQTEAGAV